MLRKAGFGLEFQGPLLARMIAEKFAVTAEQVSHTMALTDVFHVANTLIEEGQLANKKDDINRLFHHFRAQGYEGIITKNLEAVYSLNARDPNWKKRKPEITLDLAIVGATMAVTTKVHAGMFGSYVIAAQTPNGGWQVVGDVAGGR